jgi:hypothetical protein
MWIYLINYKDIQAKAEKPKESHVWGHGNIIQQRREPLIVTNSVWTLTTDIKVSVYEKVVDQIR